MKNTKTENKRKERILKEITDRLQTVIPGYSSARCALMDLRGLGIRFQLEEKGKTEDMEVTAVMNMLCANILLMMRNKERTTWCSARNCDMRGRTTQWTMYEEELEKIKKAVTENKDEKRIRACNPIDDMMRDNVEERIMARIDQKWEDYVEMIKEKGENKKN